MRNCELLIVGAGAAGMTAAASAWEAGCKSIVLIDRAATLGGVLPQCVHRGFGLATYGEELTGPEYLGRMAERLENTGVEVLLNRSVLSVSQSRTAVLSGREGLLEISFCRLILATGCRENPIGALPITGTRPAGIFTAGQAQEMINLRHQDLGENVLILGSGDLGMIMARRFTLEGKHVIAVVEKEKEYSGMARNYRRCMEQYHIPLICRATVTEVFGEGRIQGVIVRHLDSGKNEYIPCDTLVTAVGLVPEQELVKNLGAPDWLRFCGNSSRVHDIVDSAVAEAEIVGREMAR